MKNLLYSVLLLSVLVLICFLYWKPDLVALSTPAVARPSIVVDKIYTPAAKLVVGPAREISRKEPRRAIEEIWIERALAVTQKERVARILREELRFATAKSIVYLASLASLGLRNEQEDLFLALLISAQHIGFDENGKRLAALKDKSQEEQEAILRSEKTRIEDQIRSLVGEDAYQRHLANRLYEMPTRPYLTEFYGESYLRGHALDAAQLRAIENLPRDVGADATREALSSYPDPTTGLNWVDELFIQHLTGILTPAQLNILREVHADRNLYNTARRINRALADGAPGASGKTGP